MSEPMAFPWQTDWKDSENVINIIELLDAYDYAKMCVQEANTRGQSGVASAWESEQLKFADRIISVIRLNKIFE